MEKQSGSILLKETTVNDAIDFKCPECGKDYRVDPKDAGRKASCFQCGCKFTVPVPVSASFGSQIPLAIPPASAPAGDANQDTSARRPSIRTRRLSADADQMRRAFAESPVIRLQSTAGEPPDTYTLAYHVRGLARGPGGAPVPRSDHLVEIQLTREYPHQAPKCKMLTPIFHPNIEPTVICVGDHWTAGQRLVDLAVRIGQMIAYQAYNIKSPLDGEAAMWADLNRVQLPIDPRDLHPPE